MTVFHAIVLGLVQGLGEFLPISSSAHLILVPWFLGWEDGGMSFDVILHMGTLVAVGLYFAGDWFVLARAGFQSIIERRIGYDRERQMFWMLVVGSIPAGLAGILFHHLAETAFREPLIIACTLASVGFLLYWIDGNYPSLRFVEELTMKDALWIGIAQAFAIIPGVSRSGATITMGRFLGLNREGAARFSFLLSFPIILAAGGLEMRNVIASGSFPVPLPSLIGGFIASMISGLLAIHVLLQYVRNADFGVFAWYRILLGAFIIFWSLFVRT